MTGQTPAVRFALRCRGRELPLPPGLVRVGRDPSCDIHLEAEGVQGRHLLLRIAEAEVRLDPLGGAALIDGVEVPPATKLRHGAVIQLGSARLHFVDYHEGLDGETTSRITRSARLGSALDALADLDEALANERWVEARDLLSALAVELPPEIRRATLLDALTRAAAGLAAGTKASRWIDWALDLCGRHDYVPSPRTIDAIAEAAAPCGWRGGPALDRYVQAMRGQEARELVRVRRLVTIARRSTR